MGVRKQKLTKTEEQEQLLSRLEDALARAVDHAAETMRNTKAEIERSHELLDEIAHLPRGCARGNGKPDL
jgi:hypothetical protein